MNFGEVNPYVTGIVGTVVECKGRRRWGNMEQTEVAGRLLGCVHICFFTCSFRVGV